jgi:hypothetical protein
VNANTPLKQFFYISSAAGLLLALILFAGVPQGTAPVLLYSLFLPLGIACPLISGGCLLYDRFERSRPLTALLIRTSGLGFFWSVAAFFFRRLCF